MIPTNINKAHVLKAIKEIDLEVIPPRRRSTKYNIVINGKEYPPKYVIEVANNKFTNNKKLSWDDFNGGCTYKSANPFLKNLGFVIINKK